MASKRLARWMVAAVSAAVVLGALPIGPGASAAPTPTSTVVPFPLPLLEGPQVKVELGYNGPHGDATSLWGAKPAMVNFSVWWWDTGAPTQARAVVDNVTHDMSEAPVGDSDASNGTLYVAEILGTSLGFGDHTYYFDFAGPSGAVRLPANGTFGNLRLDVADRFISDPLLAIAQQVRNDKLAGTIVKTLRDAVNTTSQRLDSVMATHWDPVDGYTYGDLNHHIIQPIGATGGNLEAYVTPTGASRARFTDGITYPNNSQPAIKQALVMKGVLLATRLFNTSDVEIWTESMVVNNTTYPHPFLRVKLNDLSEEPGDGPVDGDNWMDMDLWGRGLLPAVPVGSHFGEDFNSSNDAQWTGSVGWPPSEDTSPEYVLSSYRALQNVTMADGTVVPFYMFESRPNAAITNPLITMNYWTDEPMVFDGLSSYQTANVDMFYDWVIEGTVWSALGPVWLQTVGAVGCYDLTLTVRDAFGQVDSVAGKFCLHGKTRLRQPMPDVVFPEDGKQQIDLRAFFLDDDGFGTIQFNITSAPAGQILVERFPSFAPTFNLSAPANECPSGEVWVVATDGVSTPISQHFFVNVTCVNDNPVFASGLPSSLNFTEDGQLPVPRMRDYVIDPDTQDQLVWTYYGSRGVTATYDAATDTLTFQAPPDWNGIDNGVISVTDGTVRINRTLVVQVLAANDAPRVTAPIPLQMVDEDSSDSRLDLAAYFMDPDGDNLVAEPMPGPGLEASWNPVMREVRFHPTPDFAGATVLTLRVYDPSNASVSAIVNVSVRPVNDPPVIASFDPPGYVKAFEGDVLTFTLVTTDVDCCAPIYSGDLDGDSQGTSPTGSFVWSTGFSSAGRHEFTINVSDGVGGTASHRWDVQVENRNRPPSVSIITNGSVRFRAGATVQLSADGVDPDGDPLTYTWTFGGLLQPRDGQTIEVRFPSAGNYTVKVTASDGQDQGNSSIVLIVYFDLPPPPPPPPPPRSNPTAGGFELPAVAIAIGAAGLLVVMARRRRPQ